MGSHTDPKWKVPGPKKQYRLSEPTREHRSDRDLGPL